jgi:predicted solute-binding protein
MKIAAAPFLNTRPLIYGLGGLDVEFCSPAEGARRLAESLVDIALLPVAAFARQGDLVAAPGVCIGAKHEVASVLLVADRPMEELDTIALDSSSRTSVALLRILLAARGLKPKLQVRPSPTENALIIGDAALRAKGKYVYDLAGEWRKLTGLPFVFAVWAARRTADPAAVRAIHEALLAARAWGLAHLDVLAERATRATGVPSDECRAYFAGLDYALSYKHLAGLTDFFRRLAAQGIVPDGSLQFLQVA